MTAAPALVAFRCDAGPRDGIGHVMRCVALAEEFATRGHQIVFVADLDSVPWARSQVLGRGFAAAVPPTDPDDDAKALIALRPDMVVLDSYRLPSSVYDDVRAAGVRTLALVDGDPAGRPADLWLDQNIGAEADRWPVPDGTTRLAGLDYALMRDDLRSERPATPDRLEGPVPTVLAFFGGTDPFGAAPVVLERLVGTGQPWQATVVVANEQTAAACREIVPAAGQEVRLIAPTPTLAREARAADLVLSGAGTSSWELLCLGAAAGLVCVADNQATSYERAVESGLVAGLGYLEALRSGPAPALAGLVGEAPRRAELRERGWNAVDGRGRERVADVCEAGFPRTGDRT